MDIDYKTYPLVMRPFPFLPFSSTLISVNPLNYLDLFNLYHSQVPYTPLPYFHVLSLPRFRQAPASARDRCGQDASRCPGPRREAGGRRREGGIARGAGAWRAGGRDGQGTGRGWTGA